MFFGVFCCSATAGFFSFQFIRLVKHWTLSARKMNKIKKKFRRLLSSLSLWFAVHFVCRWKYCDCWAATNSISCSWISYLVHWFLLVVSTVYTQCSAVQCTDVNSLSNQYYNFNASQCTMHLHIHLLLLSSWQCMCMADVTRSRMKIDTERRLCVYVMIIHIQSNDFLWTNQRRID